MSLPLSSSNLFPQISQVCANVAKPKFKNANHIIFVELLYVTSMQLQCLYVFPALVVRSGDDDDGDDDDADDDDDDQCRGRKRRGGDGGEAESGLYR